MSKAHVWNLLFERGRGRFEMNLKTRKDTKQVKSQQTLQLCWTSLPLYNRPTYTLKEPKLDTVDFFTPIYLASFVSKLNDDHHTVNVICIFVMWWCLIFGAAFRSHTPDSHDGTSCNSESCLMTATVVPGFVHIQKRMFAPINRSSVISCMFEFWMSINFSLITWKNSSSVVQPLTFHGHFSISKSLPFPTARLPGWCAQWPAKHGLATCFRLIFSPQPGRSPCFRYIFEGRESSLHTIPMVLRKFRKWRFMELILIT